MQKRIKIALIVIGILAVAGGLFIWETPGQKVALILERPAIEQTARAYLQAEKENNYKQVYAFLAPSSDYRKTHTYEEFLKDAGNTPKKIRTYQIVDIYRLRDNDNRRNYPLVEKFVQVEVDITFIDTGENSIYNYCFTFLKEKGTWYKG
jgi:hypothetical protein